GARQAPPRRRSPPPLPRLYASAGGCHTGCTRRRATPSRRSIAMTQQVSPVRGGPFYDRLPENTTIEPARLFADDGAESFGLLYYPAGRLPKTVCYLMHPRGDFGRHYAIPGLVSAGYAAFGHNRRYLNNDTE